MVNENLLKSCFAKYEKCSNYCRRNCWRAMPVWLAGPSRAIWKSNGCDRKKYPAFIRRKPAIFRECRTLTKPSIVWDLRNARNWMSNLNAMIFTFHVCLNWVLFQRSWGREEYISSWIPTTKEIERIQSGTIHGQSAAPHLRLWIDWNW